MCQYVLYWFTVTVQIITLWFGKNYAVRCTIVNVFSSFGHLKQLAPTLCPILSLSCCCWKYLKLQRKVTIEMNEWMKKLMFCCEFMMKSLYRKCEMGVSSSLMRTLLIRKPVRWSIKSSEGQEAFCLFSIKRCLQFYLNIFFKECSVKKNEQGDFFLCAPSVVAPTRLPATDGHCGSPSSRFLTLNWSSWSVRLETTGESSLGDPGPGDEATRDWSGRAGRERQREMETERESVCISVCVPPIICVSSAFCEGTRWGPFTPLWVLETPCSHLLLSFVTNQVPFSPSSSPLLPFLSSSILFPAFLFPSSLSPFGAASVHSWLL